MGDGGKFFQREGHSGIASHSPPCAARVDMMQHKLPGWTDAGDAWLFPVL